MRALTCDRGELPAPATSTPPPTAGRACPPPSRGPPTTSTAQVRISAVSPGWAMFRPPHRAGVTPCFSQGTSVVHPLASRLGQGLRSGGVHWGLAVASSAVCILQFSSKERPRGLRPELGLMENWLGGGGVVPKIQEGLEERSSLSSLASCREHAQGCLCCKSCKEGPCTCTHAPWRAAGKQAESGVPGLLALGAREERTGEAEVGVSGGAASPCSPCTALPRS